MAKTNTITGENLHDCTIAIGRLRSMAEEHAVKLGYTTDMAEHYAEKAVEPLTDLVETILSAGEDEEDEDLPPVTPNSRGTA
jgi:hypothetical protein